MKCKNLISFFLTLQELEAALEHASNVAFEYQKNANKYQEAIRQSSMHLDEEQKTKAIARETLANADRRAHTLQNALEESRTMLEQADRARRAAEQELQVHCNSVQDEAEKAVWGEAEERQLRHDGPHLPGRLPHPLPRLQRPLLDRRLLDENILTTGVLLRERDSTRADKLS